MRRLAGFALIAIAAIGLSFQLLRDEGSNDTPAASSAADAEPDVYGEDVLFNQLHPDGTLHYQIRADSIRQFNADDLTRMTGPKLHLLNPKQPPWDIGSNHGYIRKRVAPGGAAEEVVYLREEVLLEQTHPRNGLVTLRADTFYIYPDRQYAETDQDVMIDTEVGRTVAAGMRADLQSGQMKLYSNDNQRVHTIVLPEQFKKI